MLHTQNDSRTPPSSVYLRGRVSGISTFSFSKSTDAVPPTSRHPNVYTASHWVQNWKQNWNCPPFRFFMIETSFTLSFLRKTTKKSKFSPRRAKKNIYNLLVFTCFYLRKNERFFLKKTLIYNGFSGFREGSLIDLPHMSRTFFKRSAVSPALHMKCWWCATVAAGTFKTLPLIWGRSKRDPSPIRALLKPNPALEVVVKLYKNI